MACLFSLNPEKLLHLLLCQISLENEQSFCVDFQMRSICACSGKRLMIEGYLYLRVLQKELLLRGGSGWACYCVELHTVVCFIATLAETAPPVGTNKEW